MAALSLARFLAWKWLYSCIMFAALCSDAIALAPRPPVLARQLPLIASALLLVAAAATDTSALGAAAALGGLIAALLLFVHVVRRSSVPTAREPKTPRPVTGPDDNLRRLAASEERYRAVVEHAGDPILTFDLECTLTSVNPAAELFFGWDGNELVGAD